MEKPLLGIIANMNAGRLRRTKKTIISYLKNLEKLFKTHIIFVYERGEAFQATKEFIKEGRVNHILVVGGDGTASEVMQALLGRNEIALSLLPAGTANVFARDRGIPYDLKKHFNYMRRNKQRLPLDFYPGEVWSPAHISSFLQMAGTGIDAAIVAHTPFDAKKRWGALAYFFRALRISGRFAQIKRKFMIDNKYYEAFGMIALTNRFYGGGFSIGDRAKIPQNKLRFVLLGKRGMMGLIDLALFSFGLKRRSLVLIEAESCIFEAKQDDLTELDGDYSPEFSQDNISLEICFRRSKKFIRLYCDAP